MKVAHSCPTLRNPMDYTVYGILQARILEWVAFLFSRGSSQARDQTQVSCIQADSLPAEPQGKPTNCKGRKFKIKKPLFLGCSYFYSFTCGWSKPLPGLPPHLRVSGTQPGAGPKSLIHSSVLLKDIQLHPG